MASHLLGQTARRGEQILLPGWAPVLVESVTPAGSIIGEGTEIEVHVPPGHDQGPLSLAIVVDASLTMGEGKPSNFDRAATLVDALLLSGRAFVNSAGVLVQGGTTRHATDLTPPEDLSGALIHCVEPKGTFAIDDGIERAREPLADVEGPKAIVVVTDGDAAPENALDTAAPLAREGVGLFAIAPGEPTRLRRACEMTGGTASADPETVFDALADAAGATGEWIEPEPPDPDASDPEFEVVIERVEEPAR